MKRERIDTCPAYCRSRRRRVCRGDRVVVLLAELGRDVGRWTQQTVSPRPVLNQQEALCIGERIVDELGVSRARDLLFAAGPWHLLGFALGNNPPPQAIDRSEAETIAGVFEECWRRGSCCLC